MEKNNLGDNRRNSEKHVDMVTSTIISPPISSSSIISPPISSAARRQREYRLRKKKLREALKSQRVKPARKSKAEVQRAYRLRQKLKKLNENNGNSNSSSADVIPRQEVGVSSSCGSELTHSSFYHGVDVIPSLPSYLHEQSISHLNSDIIPSSSTASRSANQTTCLFCDNMRKKSEKLLFPQRNDSLHQIKQMATSLHDSKILSKFEIQTIAYHKSCFGSYQAKEKRLFDKQEESSWHKDIRNIHKQAFNSLTNLIREQILDNNRVIYLTQLFSRYRALLFEFGKDITETAYIEGYRADVLEKKLLKKFGSSITIEASGLRNQKIVYKTGIDVSIMADSTIYLEEGNGNKFDYVAFHLRNEIKKLLYNNDVIRLGCGIPPILFDFMVNLVAGPDPHNKDSNEAIMKVTSICSDIIFAVSSSSTTAMLTSSRSSQTEGNVNTEPADDEKYTPDIHIKTECIDFEMKEEFEEENDTYGRCDGGDDPLNCHETPMIPVINTGGNASNITIKTENENIDVMIKTEIEVDSGDDPSHFDERDTGDDTSNIAIKTENDVMIKVEVDVDSGDDRCIAFEPCSSNKMEEMVVNKGGTRPLEKEDTPNSTKIETYCIDVDMRVKTEIHKDTRTPRICDREDEPFRMNEDSVNYMKEVNECIDSRMIEVILKTEDDDDEDADEESKLNEHNTEKPFKCDQCGKCFPLQNNLRRHLPIHFGNRNYKCDQCDKCFSQKCHLNEHTLRHSGLKPFKCDECGKCFSQKGNLTAHLRIHSGLKLFKCDQCDMSFSWKSNLKQHKVMHSDRNPFKCYICGKCFSDEESLTYHSRLHYGVKPYQCDQCDSSFASKSNLTQHMLKHSGTKQYKCDQCDKSFSWRSGLNQHKLKHLGTKQFKCDQCDKGFSQKSSLKVHSLVHSGIY